MDLELNEQERAVVALVARLRVDFDDADTASAEGAVAFLRVLKEAGLLDLAKNGAQGRVQAMLVTQEAARARTACPVGTHALLAPVCFDDVPTGLIAVAEAQADVPVRFMTAAKYLVVVGADEAKLYPAIPGAAAPVATNYVYPYGYPSTAPSVPPLGVCGAALARRRWQLGVAGEIVGAMNSVLDYLVSYLSQRQQFGRALGSFQALQHRVAELAVTLECVRFLTLHAAWVDTDDAVAVAACYAATAAHTACLEAHQLSGAQGFTISAGLYNWTLRLQALSVEAGGGEAHAAQAANLIWRTNEVCTRERSVL